MFRLVLYNLKNFVLRHPFIFILFCLLSMLVSLSILNIFSFMKAMRLSDDGFFNFEKNVSISLDEREQPTSADLEKLTTTLRCVKDVLMFNQAGTVMATFQENSYLVNLGRNFTAEELQNGENVVIIGGGQVSDSLLGVSDTIKIGDMVSIDGVGCRVIGIRFGYPFHEIPCPTLVRNFRFSQLALTLDNTSTNGDLRMIETYIQTAFPFSAIRMPDSQSLFSSIGSTEWIISLLVLLIAFANIACLMAYVLSTRIREYAVFRLNGCSADRGVWLYGVEMLLLVSAPYTLSSLLYHFFISRLFETYMPFISQALNLADYALLLVFYLLAALLVLYWPLSRFCKHTAIEFQRNLR